MCSTAILGVGSNRLLAFNYDYSLRHGLVATNLRGTAKENGRSPAEPALRWTVRHGSLTFNSVGLELPSAGINEQGLCIALMRHDGGDFGVGGPLRLLDPLQWIQYQLDNYASIQEVIDGLSSARPKGQGFPLHYTLLDASGGSLLLEFMNGEPMIVRDPELPVLTNSTYAKCLFELDTVDDDELFKRTSLGRFATLARLHVSMGKASDVAGAFNRLSSVQQGIMQDSDFPWDSNTRMTSTVWSIVFDVKARSVHFRTRSNEEIRTIQLSEIDFGPTSNYLCLDIHEGHAGNVCDLLQVYRRKDNQRIVEASSPVLDMPSEARRQLVNLVDETYRSRAMRFLDASPARDDSL